MRRCRHLREQVSVALEGLVTPEEIADYWPGGAQNALESMGTARMQWIWCYAQLVRLCDRLRTVPVDADKANAARAAAQKDQPEPVRLSDGTTRFVHPKSYVALEFCTTLDRIVLKTLESVARYAGSGTEDAERVLHLAPITRSSAVAMWAWVITHPEAGLPFSPYGEEDPVPPAWTGDLTPEDILALWFGYRRVNGTRNQLIASLFPEEQAPRSRLTLEGFIGAYAYEKGGDSAHYMERVALGKLFAMAVGAAEQHEASKARRTPEAA